MRCSKHQTKQVVAQQARLDPILPSKDTIQETWSPVQKETDNGRTVPCQDFVGRSRKRHHRNHRFHQTFFFLLIALWSRHVKPSSAKGEKRLKRKKIPKFVQAEALPELEIMYKSKDHCTGMKDRITRENHRFHQTHRCAPPVPVPEYMKAVACL